MKTPHIGRLALTAGLALGLSTGTLVMAQTPTLAAYWDFNDDSDPTRTLDKIYGFEGLLENDAYFSTGWTGVAGDNAMDFGFTSENQLVRIDQVPFLNLAAAQDQITIAFWQITTIANSSSFWGVSPSSVDNERGIQSHTPWGNNSIYFDTAGCCDAGLQRISADVVAVYPDFGLGNDWFHLAFVKNGENKEIYVNGTLFHSGVNTSPLPVDFTYMILGAQPPDGGNSMQGAIDDFAVFVGALDATSIAELANGTPPDQLTGIPVMSGPLVGAAVGTPTGFTLEITETASDPVNTGSIAVQFDGDPVTIDISQAGSLITLTYTDPDGFLPAGSSHDVVIDFQTDGGTDVHEVRDFTVSAYVSVPPDFALPPGSGDAGQVGFTWNVTQNEALQGTTVQRALDQLAGRLIDPAFSQPYANLADPAAQGVSPAPSDPPNPDWAPIPFVIDTVVNLSQTAAESNGNFPDDDQMPGIPGTSASTDGIAAEVLTYVEFTEPGIYTMGVNSDDGFRTIVAPRNPKDAAGLSLGEFDAGRGAADTLFDFHIAEAGVYPFRTVWFEGGGGANIEWFTVLDDGTKVLLNDTANAGLPTFRAAAGSGVYIVSNIPGADQTGVRADTSIEVQLADGAGQTVDQGSITLTLDSITLTPTIDKSGDITTVSATLPELLASASTHQVAVGFAAVGGQPLTGQWSFSVADYRAVPPSLGSMPGSGVAAQPGLNGLVYQVEAPVDYLGTGGETTGRPQGRAIEAYIEFAEGVVAGLFGDNIAYLDDNLYPSAGGIFQLETVNFNQDYATGSIGNFQPDDPIPGIPGTSATVLDDDVAAAFTTYAEFAEPGYYVMGVNSDDGFRVTVAETVPRQYIEVEAPASIAGPIACDPASTGIDGVNFGGPIPSMPIVAEAVLADPIDACGALNNAEALVGKIALIDRGVCAFTDKARAAQDAGAVAAIIMNDRLQWPFSMGGDGTDITIPVAMIMQQDGQRLKDNLNGLVMSIGSDSGFLLGQFNGGRGSSDTLFGFSISTAGVYPLRCLWYEAGGGANVEWFTVQSDGTKILLNDPAISGAIPTYRAWNYDPLPSTDHTISVVLEGAEIVLTFEGTLQSADAVNGAYQDVAGATSPHRVGATEAAMYYRSAK